MKQRNIVMINDDYSDWKVKGLLVEVVGYDRDKRYLVKLLEKSHTEHLNIGDTIWLKPHWLDGIENIPTHLIKHPFKRLSASILTTLNSFLYVCTTLS